MKRNRPKNKDSAFFWETAGRFLNHELPDIRKKSANTVSAYRTSLNTYIDYLEDRKGNNRAGICFEDFNKENLKDYLLWMVLCQEKVQIKWNKFYDFLTSDFFNRFFHII